MAKYDSHNIQVFAGLRGVRRINGTFQTMWTDKLKARASFLYTDKELSLREVAKRLNCSVSAVQQLMERTGEIRRKSRLVKTGDNWVGVFKWTKRLEAAATEMYNEGIAYYDVAAALNIPREELRTYLNTAGRIRSKVESGRIRGVKESIACFKKHGSADIESISYSEYGYLVRRATASVLSAYGSLIDPKAKRRAQKWEIDHKYSIRAGYESRVPIGVIAHPCNLALVTTRANRATCSASRCWP